MALDRQSIEKKDFPVGRRGYDPDAVDAHLTALADEIAELKRSARKRSDTLASSASDQVRAIVEAAETSAADIQRGAEVDAREIRDEANAEAKSTREQATEQAREYVGKVSESTGSMLTRLGSMQTELDALIQSLRGGGGRLSDELRSLQSELVEVRGAVSPRPAFEPEASAHAPGYEQPSAAYPSAAEAELAPGEPGDAALNGAVPAPVADAYAPAGEYAPGDEYAPAGEYAPAPGDEYAPAGEYAPAPADEYAPAGEYAPAAYADATAESANGADGDTEGARLIALNMALNGTPREETARYLDENFALADSGGLLDEVYASVEG